MSRTSMWPSKTPLRVPWFRRRSRTRRRVPRRASPERHCRPGGAGERTPRRGRHGVAHLDDLVQEGRHLAGGADAVAADALDRELAVFALVGAGQAVLARLADPVRQPHPYGDVLAGQGTLHQAVVDPLQYEGDHVGGLADLLLDLPLPPHRLGPRAARAVEAARRARCGGRAPRWSGSRPSASRPRPRRRRPRGCPPSTSPMAHIRWSWTIWYWSGRMPSDRPPRPGHGTPERRGTADGGRSSG